MPPSTSLFAPLTNDLAAVFQFSLREFVAVLIGASLSFAAGFVTLQSLPLIDTLVPQCTFLVIWLIVALSVKRYAITIDLLLAMIATCGVLARFAPKYWNFAEGIIADLILGTILFAVWPLPFAVLLTIYRRREKRYVYFV